MIFIGDIHTLNTNYVEWAIKRQRITGKNFVQVGDFGCGYLPYKNTMDILERFNVILANSDNKFYVVRGNHDDPMYYDGHLQNHFSNLFLLPDYTLLNLENKNILLVGGATSIDRMKSIEDMKMYVEKGINRKLYWEGEKFILDEDKLKEFENIDIVVTHTAPDFCFPNNAGGFASIVHHYAENDPNLINELWEERRGVTKMYNILKEKNKIDHWLYGHFHNKWTCDFEDTKFRLLDINELFEVVDMSDYEEEMNRLYGGDQ